MIFVECNTDEFLVRTAGVAGKDIKHESGKCRVIARVEQHDNTVGLIDEDPESLQPDDLRNYMEHEKKNTIKLLTKACQGRRLIVLRPYLESWLIEKAKQNKISLKDFNLPDDTSALHNLDIRKHKNYQNFLMRLFECNDIEIIALRKWILGKE